MNLKFSPPLDPGFQPAVLWNRDYVAAAKKSGRAVPLVIGLERECGLISRFETVVDAGGGAETMRYVERLVKFLVWSRGGWRIWVGGPGKIGEHIQRCHAKFGTRHFDAELMGKVYGRPFEVVEVDAKSVPAEEETKVSLGGNLDGCRIGFDLGASDYKVAAVINGEAVYSEEFPWNPKDQSDPQYHYEHLMAGLKAAAAHLPQVDAIGGSSAGIIVDNEIRVASLLRAVPEKDFSAAAGIFKRIAREWNVPVMAVNDGDVTALAGAMSLKAAGMLGLAMGSSEAAGFMDRQGRILGWLNELAFAPVDYNPAAAADEWSGDTGVGALYFSQQAVNKLLPAAGIQLSAEMGQPEKLKEVQSLMAEGDKRAAKIYETIGIYLGYTLPYYADFYDYSHTLILGRVTTGKGGDIVIAKAQEVMKAEFPELDGKIQIHVPDEKSRRVGQAVAAASLPALRK